MQMLNKIKNVLLEGTVVVKTVVVSILKWCSKVQELAVQGFQELKASIAVEQLAVTLLVSVVIFGVALLGALAVLQDNFVGMLTLLSLVPFVVFQIAYKDIEPTDVSWDLELLSSILVLYVVTTLSYMAYVDRNLSAWLLLAVLLLLTYLSKPDKKC